VVGAGIIGLSAAWFLQDRRVAVTVVDSSRVAAGASWGNAGCVTACDCWLIDVLRRKLDFPGAGETPE
jgi:glycine/D-amino acid oxidase-like deaminating enzyme